jgi:DNA repair exonuclease SbcCD ATPase subunit
MKLRAIRLHNVGRFWPQPEAVEGIGDGLNVLAAENEVGKSTLFQAMRLVLFTKFTSKPQYLKDLRSYHADEGLCIELELSFEGKTYRLMKRYLTRAMASVTEVATNQLIAQGDDAEDWLKQVLGVTETADGPYGMLWVSQGDSLKPLISKTDAADKTQFLSSLVETEIEAVSDGGLAAAVQADASRELQTLVTKARGEPTGDYKAAIRKLDELEADIDDLQRRVNETEDARQALQKLSVELENPEVAEQSTNLKAAVTRAGKAHQAALQYQQDVQQKTTTARLTQEQFEAAEKAVTSLKSLQGKARAARAQKAKLAAKLDGLRQRHQEQLGRLEKTVSALEAIEIDVSAGRRAVEQALAVQDAGRAEKDRVRLAKDLADVEAAVAEIDSAQKALADLKFDAEALRRLEDLNVQQQQAEAERNAVVTEVTVSYDKDATERFQADGRMLADEERISVDGRLDVTVEGVGKLSVTAGGGGNAAAVAQAALTTAQDFREALAFFQCHSIDEARRQLQRKTKLMSDLTTAQSIVKRLAPDGVEALQAEVQVLEASAAAGQPEGALDVSSARQKLQEVEAAQQGLRQEKERIAGEGSLSEKDIARLEEQLAAVEQTLTDADEALGAEETWAGQLDELAAAFAIAKTARDEAATALQALMRSPLDVKTSEPALKVAEAALETFQQRREQLRVEHSKLTGSLERDQKSGVLEKLGELKDLHKAGMQKREALEQHVRALKLLVETVEEAQQATRDAFLAPVMQELTPMLDRVLPGAAVELDEKFAPRGLRRNGTNEKFQRLSGGTKEQIAILTRLAFAKLLAKKGRPVPVVLDDALVFSDDTRIERMFAVLEEAAQDVQIVFLTCRLATFSKLKAKKLQLVPHERHADTG